MERARAATLLLSLTAALILGSRVASFGQAGKLEDVPSQVDFAKQIIPLITQAGCNSGACHGAAAGRGYLSLSLFGSRPLHDYETLLFAAQGRFVDLEQVESSLLLQKPGGFLDHGGDVRLDSDGAGYALLRRWLRNGAPRGSLANLQQLKIFPSRSIECVVGQRVEISATATWQDGGQQRVTQWLTVTGAEPITSDAPQLGYRHTTTESDQPVLELTPTAAGYWPVNLRFGSEVQTLQLWVRPQNANELEYPALLPRIDELVLQANLRVGNEVASTCESHVLARRLWIDLLGRQPTWPEWQAAIAELDQGSKSVLVDRLLDSQEFRRQAGQVLASWSAQASRTTRSTEKFANAISDALLRSDNLRQIADGMLRVDESAPSELNAFHQFANDPRTRAELVASTWMGVRLGCAQCHDHPLDHWTQDDYFAMAACWTDIEPTEQGVRRIEQRTTTDLRTGRAAVARLPNSNRPIEENTPADIAFIEWLCGKENPQFASNIANRLWFWLVGSGLVEEVDDQRSTNPAINPELLEHLCLTLEENNDSLRSLVREIVLSDTYARSTTEQLTPIAQRLGAARAAKPISLPLTELLGSCIDFDAAKSGIRSGAADSESMMATIEAGCSQGRAFPDPFSASLDMVAGQALNGMIANAVARGWKSDLPPTALLEDFHRRLFGIEADAAQHEMWAEALAQSRAGSEPESVKSVIEDILWSWIVNDKFRLLH